MIDTVSATHLLDTSVFIQAHRIYYPDDICLGFWDCLSAHAQSSRLVSIDWVKQEILEGSGFVTEWAKDRPATFWASTRDEAVASEYGAMMAWVQAQPFKAEAKREFASVADGWVVAYARANDLTVVTQEVHAPNARRRVPLPNVCVAFGVPYVNTFDLLRALGARFDWSPP